MAHGYFTVEQWTSAKGAKGSRWVPILHFDSCQSLTKAAEALEKRGRPGCIGSCRCSDIGNGECGNSK